MIKVGFVRGAYLNNFEGQNYAFGSKSNIKITGISSLNPIHSKLPFEVIRLPSLGDMWGVRGVRVVDKTIKFIGNRILGDSQILFGLEKYAASFDIFHTADPHYYYSYQLAELRSKGKIKKLIVTSWETIPFNNETVAKKKFIKYFTYKYADLFVCYSKKAKVTLVREGVDAKKIMLVPLGVDLSRFRSKFDKIARSGNFVKEKNSINILFVGRLEEEKGVMDLYEAYKRIEHTTCNMKHLKIFLKIIGSGNLKSKLLNLTIKDKLQDFVLIEEKKYEEMPGVYRDANIFVLPSKRTRTWEEQYGIVLIEAMASGLPIVVYDTGAISEVVGNAGLLIREGDIKSLVISINQLIAVDDLRMKLGKMGRERAEKEFDARKTVKKLEQIYLQTITATR